MILDTNAVSDLFDGNRSLAMLLAGSVRHHLPVVVIGEYRFGLRESRCRRVLESLLNRLEVESVILAPDRATASAYADIRHELKTAGHPLPDNDIWIAALARQHELKIASRDRHFDWITGIKRLGW
ncbi:MAG: PIN domain-containing protein [Verrucomicrobia bacterium]|nr:PIN domain-containing protein [Verrucomicrobiota bacterium]